MRTLGFTSGIFRWLPIAPHRWRASVTRRRLASEASLLESIDRDRMRFKSPELGKTIEEWIVWRELTDLELQEIDTHIAALK
jgi:hypothetical protein